MNLPRRICLSGLLLFVCGIAFSQVKKNSTWIGKVVGITRDSVQNYVLHAASVAIYRTQDSSLINYRLTNNFGEFNFNNLPIGISLKIVVSYIGYKTLSRKFIIPVGDKSIDLKELNLERSENVLSEVVVKYVPPVRMNGDTLEFNSDAFKLDPNAVGEDLLRKLPGVTVWGDGTITVNGKQVSQVLVDGKPFFGGDPRIAMQNIAKTAIDKIQVYQRNKDLDNPLDSTTEVNIKLKKDKNFGHFGKLSGGYGTKDRFESDANINFFNKRAQLGIVGASNNVNKMANDANMLMRNSTYKGVSATIDYQPDFRMQGINQHNSGGVIFQYDFIPNPDYYNNDRLKGNYFIKDNISNVISSKQIITTLSRDSIQTQQSHNENKTTYIGHALTLRYDKRKNNITFYASTVLNNNNISNKLISQNGISGNNGVLQSTNNTDNQNSTYAMRMAIELGFNKRKNNSSFNKLPGNWDVKYLFNIGDNNSSSLNKTFFTSMVNPSQSQFFDRKYYSTGSNFSQRLFISLGDFSRLISGYRGFYGITLKLQNDLDVGVNKSNTLVQNGDTVTGSYARNSYLSNNSRLSTINDQPALLIGKTIIKELANRYQKILTFNLNMQGQWYCQKNASDHIFQNFTRNYRKFLPDASVSFNNNQYGDYRDDYSIIFTTNASYPTVNQLYPLVDSSNQYYIQSGNPLLKEAIERKLSFDWRHASLRTKNTFSYSLNLNAGFVDDYFADSIITDNLGRSVYHITNENGNRYLNIAGSINRPFKFKGNQLQLSFSPILNLNRTPSNINGTWNFSNSLFNSNSLSIYYTLVDWWAVNLVQSLSFYRSKQSTANNNEFKNSTASTALSTSLNFTKKLSVNSSITYNRATSTGSAAISYTIWNANAAYRFFSGNNLELKFAALDLLHQNTNIINYGSTHTLTRGTTNVLQQYFILTVSYFPRKFGKKD